MRLLFALAAVCLCAPPAIAETDTEAGSAGDESELPSCREVVSH